MIEVEIKLFGAFRKYVPSGYIRLETPDHISIADFKKIIQQKLQEQFPTFHDENLVNDSALATDSEVLVDDMKLCGNQTLALLPPVCGG